MLFFLFLFFFFFFLVFVVVLGFCDCLLMHVEMALVSGVISIEYVLSLLYLIFVVEIYFCVLRIYRSYLFFLTIGCNYHAAVLVDKFYASFEFEFCSMITKSII